MAQNLVDFRVYLLIAFVISVVTIYIKRDFYLNLKNFFEKKSKLLVTGTTVIFFIYFLVLKYFSWKSGAISGTDFAHFDYVFWNISKGNGPILSIDDHLYYKHLFGNHFAPIVYLLAIPYFFVSSHFIPFVYQALFLSLTFLVSFVITRDIFKRFEKSDPNFWAYLCSFSLISYQFTLRIFKYEFHHEIVYLLLGLWVLYEIILLSFFDEKRWLPLLFSAALYLSVKEDAPLNLLGPFLFAMVIAKKRQKIFWGIFALTLVTLFFIIFKKIMPSFTLDSSKNNFIPMWSKYGANITQIAQNIILRPHLVLSDIFFRVSFYKALLPWLFLPLVPWYILIFMPALTIALTSSDPQYHHLLLYYSAPLVPFVYLSFIMALNKNKISSKANYIITISLLINLLLGIGTLRLDSKNGAIDFIRNQGQSELDKILQSITAEQKVYVTGGLLPQINYHQSLRRFMGEEMMDINISSATAIVVAPELNLYPLGPMNLPSLYQKLADNSFKLEFDTPHLKIFKR